MGASLEEILDRRLADTRHTAKRWDIEYLVSPYLANLSDRALHERYLAICKNISFLVTELRDQVPIQAHWQSTWWWLRKWTHISTEYQQRRIQPPRYSNVPKGPTLPAPFEPTIATSCERLVRYGEAKWFVPLAERGSIRFKPASNYKNEELGSARFDDELNQSTFISGDHVTVTSMAGKRIPIVGDLQRTARSIADMFVFCTATAFDARLFAEFPDELGNPANAYCVIWDVKEFSRRIVAKTQSAFMEWSFHDLPILYFDPYENGKSYISPGVSKKFEYAYQREYRFTWLPSFPCSLREPIDVEIGPLNDIVTVFSSDGLFLAGAHTRSAA
jgi:hypothetical protein